ncbi:multidrug resistance-associated protein 1-like [Anopheles ziemanni]|uniref:multidrug resistance-associated protein 1-like n=1 Tax=Anopheles coustani TaxID=139045 RepID=UPI0026588442|nr:multidrug resistance-associated protein 1-like [Anopheles coustani]XP_058168679.1 multidrug resistance-associated protein 1-like [Anopheles ziemanni]
MIEVGIDLLDHGVVYGLQYLLLWILGWSELFYIAQSASLGHSSRGTSGRLLSIGLIFLTLASTALAVFREVSESDGTVAKVIETISMMLVCLIQIYTVGRNVDHVYLFSFWTLRLLALSMDVLEYWESYDLLHTFFAVVWLVLCSIKSLRTPAPPSHTEPNLIRQLYFSWLDPLYREAHSGSASFYDGKIFDQLQDDRRCDALLEWFRNPRNGGAYAAVGKAEDRVVTIGKLLAPFRWDIVCTGLNRFVSVSFYFLCSYLLRVLLEENQSQMVQKWIVTGLFATSITIAVLNTQYQHATRDIGLRLQSLLMGTVYENMLQEVPPLASSATLTTDTGTFVSLMQNLHMMWSGPLIILVTFGALWWIIGWTSAVVGFLIMGLTIWGTMVLARKLNVQQIAIKRAMDARVKLTTDSIEQIQQIKSDQLEEVMERRIGAHRGQELGHMRASIWYEATKHLVGIATPMVVAYGTFLFMEIIGSGSLLTVQSMFVAISLFNITRYPMSVMPTLFTSWNDTKLSLQRINVFIQSGNKELEQPALPTQPPSSSSGLNGGAQKRIRQVSEELSNILVDQNHRQPEVVQIDRGQFSIKDKMVLHDISLKLRRGTFTALYGTHASGKTSLLRAIIGSIRKTSGTMNVPVETMSYCQQTPWIHSGTVRSNILFGEVFDPARYAQVIRACCLEEDFTSFTGGDQRMVGDGGHSLSGGQASRVSLARAVYKKAQLYLFDDPLKSLDLNVSRKVLEEVFNRSSGLLADCTCLFVSHNPEHLQVADSVVIMREGTIEDILNPSQTIERYGSVIFPGDLEVDEEKSPQEKKLTKNGNPLPMRNRKRITKSQSEPSHQGSVPIRLYVDFGRMLGWFNCTLIVALETIVTWLDIYITIRLAQQKETGLLLTGAIVIGWTICLFLKTELLHFRGLSLAKKTHINMLATIFRQPMTFFDQNDSGVVVNRFSNDLNVLDAKIVPSVRNVLTSCFAVLGTLFLFAYKLSSVLLLLIMAVVCAGALLFGLSRLLSYHLRVARTLKRLESSSRSPIVLQYNETVQGIDTIKAFGAEKRFFRQFLERVDQHQNYVYHNLAAQRWIGIRLEFIGAIVIYYVALLTVTYRSLVGMTFVAIIVSYVLRLIPSLNGLLLASGLLEENIISFERVSQYLNLPREYLDDGGVAYPTNNANGKPSRGPIEFRDFSLAHADGSTVLHNLTLTIGAGEKVGIIGRTGAGKSSFVGALFRFYPKHTSGYILIDGVDVAKISLKSLRRSIALVPQSTTLLSGRVQDFVDPHNAHPIERLTSTLRLCELGNVPLDAALEELSVGQRQLLCMVRGLLYNRPIIVLDEATSALDDGMERLILRLIREHFHDRTVLMIAHRLNTVKSCDRILWLQDGRIHKLAPPSDFSSEDWNVLKHGV